MNDEDQMLYRVLAIGNAGVGKTSIVNYKFSGKFNPSETTTTGACFYINREEVNGSTIEMQIWDTAGQEKYRALGPIYYRNADAAFIVFALTEKRSFDELDTWIKAFTSVVGTDVLIYLVGNKSDCVEELQISHSDIEKFANDRKLPFLITSAKTGEGIDDLFQIIAKDIQEKGAPPKSYDIQNLRDCKFEEEEKCIC